MPICQIDFPTENFSRIDRFKDPYSDLDSRFGLRATEIFWKDESTYLQWNHDPFYYGIFYLISYEYCLQILKINHFYLKIFEDARLDIICQTVAQETGNTREPFSLYHTG